MYTFQFSLFKIRCIFDSREHCFTDFSGERVNCTTAEVATVVAVSGRPDLSLCFITNSAVDFEHAQLLDVLVAVFQTHSAIVAVPS